jgi:hypothetical protein
MRASLPVCLNEWNDTIRCLAGIRQGNATIIGLNLNDLGPLPYRELGIWAIQQDAEKVRQRKKTIILVYLVCLVCLVDLVHLVSFDQPKNQKDHRNQTDQAFLRRVSLAIWDNSGG